MNNRECLDRYFFLVLCLTTLFGLLGTDSLSQGSIRGGIPSRELQEEEEDVMDLRFSLWHPGLRAVDVKDPLGRFFNNVHIALNDFLCEEADVAVVNGPWSNRCMSMNSNVSDFPLLKHQNSTVEDANEGEMEWTEWVFTYAIINVGSEIEDQAEVMDESRMSIVMENIAQLALDVNILEGAMDGLVDGVKWSRADQEVATFQPFVQGDDSSSSTNNEDGQGSDSRYEPPGHLLRIIGAVLFGLNLCTTLYLQRLGRLGREQREREAVTKEEELGGLVTEAGLDRMLDIGKRESMVLYDESQEFVARHGGGGGSSKLFLLQDKACVVLPEDYNVQDDPTYADGCVEF
jgi:hypothetical protein